MFVGVVRFTLLQAALSTAPVAHARRGAGAGAGAPHRVSRAAALFIAALNLASVLPAIVAVFGIVAVLGRAGWLGRGLRALRHRSRRLALRPAGHSDRPRLLQRAARRARLPRLARRGARRALAARRAARHAARRDLPLHRPAAPAARGAGHRRRSIFLLCFTSFAVVLALGGGPERGDARSRDLRIRPLRRGFRPRRRCSALLQVAICLAVVLPVLWLARRPAESAAIGVVLGAARCRRSGAAAARRRGARSSARLLVLPPLAAVARVGRRRLAQPARAPTCCGAAATSFAIARAGGAARGRRWRWRSPARRGALAHGAGHAALRRRHDAAGRADPRRPAARRLGRALRRPAPGRRSVRARAAADRARQRPDGAALRAPAGRAAADPLGRALRPPRRQPRHRRDRRASGSWTGRC